MLVKLIKAHGLPFTANVVSGAKRSDKQNRLQRLWMNQIAEQLPQQTSEEWRGYCKLHFGVPIMRAENEDFMRLYDEIIRPLPYNKKLALMMIPLDLPVTRDMSSKQKTDYLDQVQKHFAEQGVELVDPEGGWWERVA